MVGLNKNDVVYIRLKDLGRDEMNATVNCKPGTWEHPKSVSERKLAYEANGLAERKSTVFCLSYRSSTEILVRGSLLYGRNGRLPLDLLRDFCGHLGEAMFKRSYV